MSVASNNSILERILPRDALIISVDNNKDDLQRGAANNSHMSIKNMDGMPFDDWCNDCGIRHVDCLILNNGESALRLLESAILMLRLRRIDFVQFSEKEVGENFSEIRDILRRYGYDIVRFSDQNGRSCREIEFYSENFMYLAVAPRHKKRLFTGDTTMFRYADLFPRYGILPRGIIHIGAHEGEEYSLYAEADCRKVIFIEADPNTFSRLLTHFSGNSDVICINRAVSDRSGRLPFSRMSGSQSSSLLPPKEHLGIYPSIRLTETIEVDAAPLPNILSEFGIDVSDYNVLAIDTQGAERMILAGCGKLLSRFDAIAVEVNYAELYQGCGRIADIDDLLFPYGYERVEEISPFHHTWGDAFYVRRV